MKISLSILIKLISVSFICLSHAYNSLISHILSKNSNRQYLSTKSQRSSELKVSNTENILGTGGNEAELRKWFFLNYNKRPDSFVSKSSFDNIQVISEIWKSILISIRVLEKDEDMKQYTSLISFENIESTNTNFENLSFLSELILNQMQSSSPLFQNSFARTIKAIPGPTSNVLVSVDTVRTKKLTVDYEDVDEYVPSPTEILTNDIKDFPFPTVYDFISEINRPPDPLMMASGGLRFKYSIKDLKFDVEKMKKKKNPQELVDSINCKLTRLANWKDVLSKEDEDQPDPFIESAEWGQNIKLKYQSLKALKSDPKKALDTQYDKRKTFIKIIDQWSDRLKRSFKFIYQSQRPPEDFMTPILKSKWRNEVLNTSKIFSQVAFLDLKGPDFVLGEPSPLFDENRYLLWESDYPAEVAMFEMLAWLKDSDPIIFPGLLDSISHHTYSRGLISERVLSDFWVGLSAFLNTHEIDVSTSSSSLNATDILNFVAAIKNPQNAAVSQENKDHTDIFIDSLHSLNQLTRELSSDLTKPVKEMYRDLFVDGKELVDWWTTIVRDLDLIEEVHNAGNGRTRPWSEIMSEIVYHNLENDKIADDDPGKATYAASNIKNWKKFKPVMETAEKLEALLPWKNYEKPNKFDIEKLASIPNSDNFKAETVHLNFKSNGPSRSYLFVCPRYFRGTDLDEELTAFLEFGQIVSQSLLASLKPTGTDYSLKLIHPKLIDNQGIPIFSGRGPHPAVIITLNLSQ